MFSKGGQDRSTRSKQIKDKLNVESGSENLLSVNALSGEGYSSMRNKEARDSVSPTRYGQAADDGVHSEDELELLNETENMIKALQKAGKQVKVIKSEIPVRRDIRNQPQNRSPSPKKASPTRTNKSKTSKLDDSVSEEFGRLRSLITDNSVKKQILVNEDEEELIDEFGNRVQMFVTTHKDKDGKEFTTRRTARTTKIVENIDDIDEILIGNPDHEVLERDVREEEDKDGSKIKIITETRRRPDGIEYTTKNVLKTSKIFDYDHPEDVNFCESDQLISTSESEETDENGVTIRTVTETRRKCDGTEYTTKKVYKTSKVSSRITPSDDDEIVDTKETEERDAAGNVTRIVVETRRTASGEEYTHRQVFKCRRMTLTGVELQKGLPMMDNDDEVLNKKEKKEKDEHGMDITVVTETRRRKDGTKYTFDYILRSFKGSEAAVKSMPVKSSGATNIKVSDRDELIKEEVKEEEQKDGSTLKTIIERRRAQDGTEYLRHRIMKIPQIPEPKLTVGTMNDEILENDIEEMEFNGTRIKSITERRRSSLTGLQYTLRRMSKTYQQTRRPSTIPGDEVIDENVTEEESEEGTIIKTVIRRYQRKDGSMYTTHHINKSFTAPAHVVLEDEGELIDQTMNQKETDDGFIIKTVTETYERADGAQYTIERSEKSEKDSASVMYKNDYPNQRVELITPKTDDVVLSQEVEEQPDDDGLITKVVTEERQRANGTKYVTKITMSIIPELVPEAETSYVIIKPDDGMIDSELLPSMDDELVYTRKREENDEDGNPITVVIETRKSRVTGEKYNITKRVFTTDVVRTETGEKVIKKYPRSTTTQRSPADKVKSAGTVSTMKDRLASKEKKDQNIKEKEKPRLIRVNTADRRKLFENVTDKSSSRAVKSTNVSITAKVRVGKSDTTVEETNAKNIQLSRSSDRTDAKRDVLTRKQPVDDKKVTSVRKVPAESTPSATKKSVPTSRTPLKETQISPDRTNKAPARRARSPVNRVSPKASRDASPTGGRHRCHKHGPVNAESTSSSKRTSPSKPASKDAPKMNGDVSTSKKSQPETHRSKPTEIFDSPRRSPPTKLTSSSKAAILDNSLKTPKQPIVSLPQTPMNEEIKLYPCSPSHDDEPIIEDVSYDPDLPQHNIHRPSIIREPSEYPDQENDLKALDSPENECMEYRKKSLTKPLDSDDKRKPYTYTRKNSSEIPENKVVSKYDLPKRGTGNVVERYQRFDKADEVKSRKVSLEVKDSVSLKRSIFEREDKKEVKEPLTAPKTRPDVEAAKTMPITNDYENRTPVEEPLIVPKYFHPLGDEKENEKPKRPSLEPGFEMASPKLIMRLTSLEQDSNAPTRRTSRPDENVSRRSSRDSNADYHSVKKYERWTYMCCLNKYICY